jgi:hypothetical protein
LYIDLKKIALNFEKHSVSTIYFQDIKKFWKSKIRDYYLEGLTKLKIGNRAPEFNFPYISQGRVDSPNLFGINEIILFAYYEKTIGTQYTKVLDLGANVGTNSKIGDIQFPNFTSLAKSFGYKVGKATSRMELKMHLKSLFLDNSIGFLEVEINKDAKVIPQTRFGYPLEDSEPELPKEELIENIIIPVLRE